MGHHDHEAVNGRLRAQVAAVVALVHRLDTAVEKGKVPEGWHCRWCVETAAAEIRSALGNPFGRPHP